MLKQLKYELVMFFREGIYVFFCLLLPAASFYVFGSMFKTQTYEGLSYFGHYIPGFISIIMFTSCIFSVGFYNVMVRENGVLKRLLATPMNLKMIYTATLIRGFTIAIVGVLEIFLIAGLVFNEKLTNSWIGFCTAYVIVALSALTIGFTIGFIFKKSKTALMAMMVAIYPVMFLSDATIPLSQMPSSFQKVAPYINPVYHMNIILRNSWNGDLMCKASYKSVTYLLVWVVAMLIIAKLCYRREE